MSVSAAGLNPGEVNLADVSPSLLDSVAITVVALVGVVVVPRVDAEVEDAGADGLVLEELGKATNMQRSCFRGN